MAVFKFKLDTLRRLKTQLEDQAKNIFGAAVARLNREAEKLKQIYAAIETTYDEYRTVSGGKFTAGKLKEYNSFIEAMKDKAAAQELVVAEARKAADIAREEMISAMREREKFDKLREKAYESYLSDEKRAEHRSVDELTSYRTAGAGSSAGIGG